MAVQSTEKIDMVGVAWPMLIQALTMVRVVLYVVHLEAKKVGSFTGQESMSPSQALLNCPTASESKIDK